MLWTLIIKKYQHTWRLWLKRGCLSLSPYIQYYSKRSLKFTLLSYLGMVIIVITDRVLVVPEDIMTIVIGGPVLEVQIIGEEIKKGNWNYPYECIITYAMLLYKSSFSKRLFIGRWGEIMIINRIIFIEKITRILNLKSMQLTITYFHL